MYGVHLCVFLRIIYTFIMYIYSFYWPMSISFKNVTYHQCLPLLIMHGLSQRSNSVCGTKFRSWTNNSSAKYSCFTTFCTTNFIILLHRCKSNYILYRCKISIIKYNSVIIASLILITSDTINIYVRILLGII